jgi:hypothetical protein
MQIWIESKINLLKWRIDKHIVEMTKEMEFDEYLLVFDVKLIYIVVW